MLAYGQPGEVAEKGLRQRNRLGVPSAPANVPAPSALRPMYGSGAQATRGLLGSSLAKLGPQPPPGAAHAAPPAIAHAPPFGYDPSRQPPPQYAPEQQLPQPQTINDPPEAFGIPTLQTINDPLNQQAPYPPRFLPLGAGRLAPPMLRRQP